MRNAYDQADIGRMIDGLVAAISAEFPPSNRLNLIGIRTRGESLAQRLTQRLAARGYAQLGRGVLDITMYRDDLSEVGPRPLVRPTQIDVRLDGTPLVLVDDVLFTGRSVRAGLDALTDFGRPSVIRLAVLVDRAGRELPIQADYVGLSLGHVPASHRVNVRFVENDAVDEVVVEPKG